MKKLDYKQIYKLITTGIINIPRKYHYQPGFHNDTAMLMSLEEIQKNIPSYPINDVDTVDNQYVVLKSYDLLMKPHSNLHKYSTFIQEWVKLEIEYSKVSTSYNSHDIEQRYLVQQKCHEKAFLLESILYRDVYNKDITDIDFWKYIEAYKSSDASSAASIFAKLFDTIEEVLAFQKIMSKNVSYNGVQYQTFIKALKIAPNYSLEDVPDFLVQAMQNSYSETVKIDAAKALKKYRFDLTKDYYVSELKNSKRQKFNNFVEEILKENNALEKKNFSDILLQEDNAILHEKKIALDFTVLKSLVNNDGLLAETLAAIYTKSLSSHYRHLAYYIDTDKIYFTAVSENESLINQFSKDLIKAIEYTYSENYLDSGIPVKLNNHSRGERIHFEANVTVINHYLEHYHKWKLKDNLENALNESTTVVKRNKL